MTSAVRLFLLVLTWSTVALRIPALISPRQRPVWLTLFSLGLGVTVLQAPFARTIDRLSGTAQLSRLISGLLAVGLATALLAFAVNAQTSAGLGLATFRRTRRLAAAIAAMAMTIAFLVSAAASAHANDRFLPLSASFSAISVYWLAYLSYEIVATVWATVLFWRLTWLVRSRWLRAAIALLAVGTSLAVLYFGTRVAVVLWRQTIWVTWGTLLSSAFFVLVALGCSIVAMKPLGDAVTTWLDCRRLYPLWRDLSDAAPQIALEAPRGRLLDSLTFTTSQLRRYRRLVEIRDGFLLMREWVTLEDLDRIAAIMSRSGITGEQAEATRTACWLTTALHAQRLGLPRTAEPLDLVRPGGADTGGELRWVKAVIAAWRSPLVRDYAATFCSTRRASVLGGEGLSTSPT